NLIRQTEENIVEAGETVKLNVIDLGLTTERRIRAIEYMPSDRRVVRAAFFTVQETGEWIGSWTPWYGFMELPSGVGFRLPAGSHILAQTYYRGAKERVVERGTLGLFFADKPTPNTASHLVFVPKDEGDSKRFRAETRLTSDMNAIALRLETDGAKSVEVSARRPDGGTDVLLFARDVKQDWPTPYIFKEPVLLRRGTVLSVTSYGSPVKVTVSRY